MYRGRRQPNKAVQEAPAQPTVEEHEAPSATQPQVATATPLPLQPPLAPPTAHGSTVLMKEKFTAPFMIYDTTARRIVANPQYDRSLAAELHRVQSILLTKLRTPMQAHLSYTPKELLYELEAALYHVCASLAISDDTAALRYVLSDGEADPAMPQLESFLAHHNAPAKAVVAMAHCLGEGTSHDILVSFLQMLEQRVQTELDPAVDRRRSEAEHAALRGTKNNLQDMAQLVRDVQTAYRSIDTASQAQRRQPQSDPTEVDMARSPAANAVPAGMVEASFYKVLRWVLAVDTDRRALRAAAVAGGSTTVTAPSDATTPAAVVLAGSAGTAAAAVPLSGFAKVTEYDPFTGRLTLERADVTQRWGLLLNGKGLLVGLENELRNSSEAGERLYDAVQQQSGEAGGLAIFDVNRRRTRPVHLADEEVSASSGDIMQKLRTSLTQQTKTLHVSIEKRKQADLTVPREVLFEVSYQGGEGGVGQRCMLMVERASTSISWGLKLKYLKGSPAVLSDYSPSMKLSGAARNLLFDMRGRLRVLRINNQEMAKLSAEEMRSVISGSLLLTLHLQVTDTNGDVPVELEAAPAHTLTTEPAADADASEAHVVPAAEEPADTLEAVNEGEDAAPAAGEAAEVGEHATHELVSASVDEEADPVKAELDDVAAAIADEFLQEQTERGKAAAALAEEDAMAPEFEDAAGAATAEIEAAADPFEELDWAKPTTTIGAPGDNRDDEDGDGDAEAALDGDGDKAAELAAHEDDIGLHEGTEKDAAVDAVEDGDKDAVEEPAEGAEAAAAAEEGRDAALEALDEDAEEPAKKTRGRKKGQTKKAQTQKAKKAAAAAAKKAKKTRSRKDSRKEKKSKAADAEEDAAEADADEAESLEAQNDEAAQNAVAAEEGEAAAGIEAAAEAEADDAIAESEPTTKAKRGRKPKAAAAEVEEPEAEENAVEEADLEAKAEDDSGRTHRGRKKTEAALAEAADVPLVELPTTSAELAIKHAKQGARKRQTKAQEADAVDAVDDGDAEGDASAEAGQESARVSLNQMLKAKPLIFENEVRLERFDGSTLELERSSTQQPWNIKVAFAGDDIIMTKLPPFAATQLKHPFLRSLGAGPQGEVKWIVDGLNGQDLSMMSKLKKTKALDAIKGATKLSFVLKALRK